MKSPYFFVLILSTVAQFATSQMAFSSPNFQGTCPNLTGLYQADLDHCDNQFAAIPSTREKNSKLSIWSDTLYFWNYNGPGHTKKSERFRFTQENCETLNLTPSEQLAPGSIQIDLSDDLGSPAPGNPLIAHISRTNNEWKTWTMWLTRSFEALWRLKQLTNGDVQADLEDLFVQKTFISGEPQNEDRVEHITHCLLKKVQP